MITLEEYIVGQLVLVEVSMVAMAMHSERVNDSSYCLSFQCAMSSYYDMSCYFRDIFNFYYALVVVHLCLLALPQVK